MKQVRLYVKGDVIGVGFRAWSKIQAKAKKVSGWSRNVHDSPEKFGPQGGVEIIAQAEEEILTEFVEKIKEGSPVSRVDHVEILVEEPREIYEGFEIIK